MTDFIGETFPEDWLWSKYENQCIDSIRTQIDRKFAGQRNLLVNMTWFGPQFDYPNNSYDKFLKHTSKVDNLFILCTVDPSMLQKEQIENMLEHTGNPKLYKLGNFDGEHQFNFFAPVLAKHFRKYENSDIVLKDPKWHLWDLMWEPFLIHFQFGTILEHFWTRQLLEKRTKKSALKQSIFYSLWNLILKSESRCG